MNCISHSLPYFPSHPYPNSETKRKFQKGKKKKKKRCITKRKYKCTNPPYHFTQVSIKETFFCSLHIVSYIAVLLMQNHFLPLSANCEIRHVRLHPVPENRYCNPAQPFYETCEIHNRSVNLQPKLLNFRAYHYPQEM